MCGRFVAASPPEEIANHFAAALEVDGLGENYNVAPTHDVYGVVVDRDDTAGPALRAFHWGLIPSWAKDRKIASRMINARSETLDEKRSFSKLFHERRLLIPMDGFYEWAAGDPDGPRTAKGAPVKRPFFISCVDDDPLAVAGLWTLWKDRDDPDGRWLQSATVLTTSANETMSAIHDRMPVIVPRDRWAQWLDPDNRDVDTVKDLFAARHDGVLEMHPVTTDVNDVRNNAAHLVEPA
ncbi:SOS response-associated peptidase [Ilumatobacter sp.]|uniref:SOS response-associated peptidase n=1 Tax=Ilumatobacter sp. TaxID=1967498 RepID=UPI003B52D50A